MSSELFCKLAEPILKVPNFVDTSLYTYMADALCEITQHGGEDSVMYSMKWLSQLIDLYAFVQPKGQANLLGKSFAIRRTSTGRKP